MVFHVSFLKAYHADKDDPTRQRSQRPPSTMQTCFTEQAEDILAHCVVDSGSHHHAHQTTFYLIKCADKPKAEATWEKEIDLWQFKALIQQYYAPQAPTRALDSTDGGNCYMGSTIEPYLSNISATCKPGHNNTE